MAKTGSGIQGDIYRLLKNSALASMLSGSVYRQGLRPRDSGMEDAVVIFTAGLPGDVQSGIVTVNIYIPDIDPYANGVLVADGGRCEQIERAAQQWVESLTADKTQGYLIRLNDTIWTEAEPEIGQHFVVIKMKYKYSNH